MAEPTDDDGMPSRPPAASDPLLAELRHSSGNLLHRMRYWTELLETQPLGAGGTEALGGLRASLDGLQELITGTLELLRPSEVRRIAIPGADIVRSIAVRFGDDRDHAGNPDVACGDVRALVDPGLLDRALTLLVEALLPELLHPLDAAGVVTHVAASLVSLDAIGGAPACLAVAVRARGYTRDRAELFAAIHHGVNVALARKLLADSGCTFTCSQRERVLHLEIALPIEARN